ncbi:MFS transporter [Luteimicrobium sp. NPDC057192]|uniref:MFS transporter n=1 Tax=Luteimicrobium sp. NPDC057192 TaxID=3346042 RepID=UPI00363BC658
MEPITARTGDGMEEAATMRDTSTAAPRWTTRLATYVIGASLVRLADEGARVALVLLVLERTGGAALGGILVAALLVPHVVAAPAMGRAVDRAVHPSRVLAAAATAYGAALGLTPLLVGRAPLAVVLSVLVVGGCCGPALTGGLTSRLADLVPGRRLPRTYGVDSLTYNVSAVAGPAVAAAIGSLWGAAVATLVLAACCAAGAAFVVALPASPSAERAGRTPSRAAVSGVRAIRGDRVLWTVTAASSLGQLGPGALPVVVTVLCVDAGAPAAAGWLLAATAVGALFGSLWWTWRPTAGARAPGTAMWSLVGIGGPVLAAAATPGSLAVVSASLVLGGVFRGPFTGALFTTRHDRAPEGAQAQVFSISAGLKTTAYASGAALAGLVAHLTTGTQLALVGGSSVIAAVLGLLGLRTARSAARVPGLPQR